MHVLSGRQFYIENISEQILLTFVTACLFLILCFTSLVPSFDVRQMHKTRYTLLILQLLTRLAAHTIVFTFLLPSLCSIDKSLER
ncbi:hypothetical protein NEPTK9_000787 [Candidatus Neptunochlamydia vexilliferae]|uniref:Uncharacterized protein n=1 Tax=Candidatus Neptunichlamydia vexilliferae TaxID=1651774 RepID=A0ABS0AYS2_9BACT|nr:hypothetical protein [Candidatus Neptunochlamydia vexilliferae]